MTGVATTVPGGAATERAGGVGRRRSRPRRGRSVAGVAVVAAASLLAASCAPAELDGDVTIGGSETLRPFLSRVAGSFTGTHPLVDVDVDLQGTADGLALFCDGLVDLAAASRPMSEREARACASSGVEPVEVVVALDAVAVVSAPGSGPACVDLAELYAATGPEAGGVDSWGAAATLAELVRSDPAVAAATGAGTGPGGPPPVLPGAEVPLGVIARASGSGTVDTFVDLAIEPIAEPRRAAAALRPDVEVVPANELILSATLAGPADLGIVGFPDARAWGDQVRRVGIDAGDGCVEPTAETIRDGRYPFGRRLFLYADGVDLDQRRTEVALVDLVLSDEGQRLAGEAGTVTLDGTALAAARSAWEQAAGG